MSTTRSTVKESIVLANGAAGSSFSFDVTGADLALTKDGGVRLTGAIGDRFAIPAPTVFAADGSDVTEASGAHYEIRARNGARPATQLVVSVDPKWLVNLPLDQFPLVIDPSFYDLAPASKKTFSSTGATYSGSGVKLGRDSSARVWRGAAYFDEYEDYFNSGYRIYDAALMFSPVTTTQAENVIRIFDEAGEPTSWSQIGGDEEIASVTVPAGGDSLSGWGMDVSPTMEDWRMNNEPDQWFGLRGTEAGVTAEAYNVYLHLTLYLPPDPSVVTTVTNDQVLSTTRPMLHADPVDPAEDGTLPDYEFVITTGPQPDSGEVVSGRSEGSASDPWWKVPAGALVEGVTYYAWVLTDYGWGHPTMPTQSRRFTVNLGLGEGGPSPTDSVGSVPGSAATPAEGAPSPSLPGSKLNVNLVNGNLSLTAGSKALGTLTGAVKGGLTYNSITVSNNEGLAAEFFNDANGNGTIDNGVDPLVATRVDPTVHFYKSTGVLASGQDPTRALARWSGSMSLPAGRWKLGGWFSDDVRITSDSTVLFEQSTPPAGPAPPTFGTEFQAQPNMPIKIEWHNTGGEAIADVVARNVSTGEIYYTMSPDWFSHPSGPLPAGWTLNGDATTARWVSLQDFGTWASVFSADGSSHVFMAVGNGAYTPPLTAPTDLLTLGDGGRFVLKTANGQTYTFRPDGNLESLVNAADALNPAALDYGYSGSPLRLRTIRDRVSNRTVTLYYGGDTECGAGSGAPGGMLCQIAYWDNTVSALTYEFGRLARLVHPGDTVYQLAYNSSGLLKSVQDPLAAAAVTAGVRNNDATVLTEITYDANGRVSTVTQPAPSAGAARPKRTYTYTAGQTEVDVAGFNPPSGFTERVRYDSRNRITERTEAAGLTTTHSWDAKDRQIASTDPAGLRTTTHYDHRGRVVANYGPAPTSSFDANGYPLTGATVPLSTTEYDGGIVGLAATYWANPYLAGPPKLHGTGLGASGDMDKDWNTTLPVTPEPGGWSARFSGDLNVATADSYTWQIQTRGSVARMWVDDVLVLDHNQPEPATGWSTTTGAAGTLTVGKHSIRVDMTDTSGPAGLKVLWSRVGGPTFVAVPGSVLGPNYGLVTSVTDPDGKVTRTEYSDPVAGIGPEYRLPTATIVDPNGANLRTVTSYEPPGASSFLRRIGRTLPAGNTTITTNYGGTEPPLGGSGTSSISVRATSVGQNIPPATTVVLPTPVGVAPGDLMIAAVGVRGVPTVTAPSDWTFIRSDSNGSSMKLLSYWRVATDSEPTNSTWSFSSAKAAAGSITAYTGVSTATPVDVHSGFANTTDSSLIVAPSITTTGPDERLIGLFSIMKVTPIAPPTGMQELAETSASGGSEPPVTIETADTTQPIAGPSGDKTATAGTADRNNGQLIALRPLSVGPCSIPASTPQGGKPKRITHPDSDGAGPEESRIEELIYDAVGRQVGRRVGTPSTIATVGWACTSYDAKGRLTSESWPATATDPARTVAYLHGIGGNPLVNAVTDSVWGSAGITATVDLLGRTVSYTDIYGDTTTTTYDQAGRLTNTNGPGGNRTQNYTPEGQAGTVQVNGSTLATPTYDFTTGRLSSVAYANGTTTTLGYDNFGRTNATSATKGSTTITGDQVTYSLDSRVRDQQVYTGTSYVDANSGADNYFYDGAGRVTDGRLPGTTYAYGYGTSSGCTAPNAGKNTNRSTLTITGTGAGTKSCCYDHADRLVSSTDYTPGSVAYDGHGNTTQLGDKTLDFDAADRHIRTETPTTVTRYWRDPLNRIVDRVDMTKTIYVASSTATATGTAVTVNRPAGTQAGDLIVAALTIASPGTNLTASGWNVAVTQAQGTQRTWILWRYATGTDPGSWTLGTDGTSTALATALVTYRGPTALTPVTLSGVSATTAATTHPLPQVTTSSDANQLIHVVGLAGNTTATVPSGVASRATAAGSVSLLVADRYQPRPGMSPTANATTGTALNSASLTIAIVPAATDQRLGYAGHSDSPSHLDDGTGALIERYYGLAGGVTITEKTSTAAATIFSDDFTGTNGAAWNGSKWATTSNDSTKKVDIQSNQGELYVNGASARATATMSPVVDSEATFSYRFSDRNASSFLRVFTKASGATGANQMPNAYRLEIASNSSTVVLQKFVGGSATQIGSFPYTADTNTHRVRFRVQGTTIQAKVWPDGTTEPANWSVTATDGAVTAAGVVQIAHSHTSGARSVYLDDLVVTSGVTPDRTWSYANIHGDVTATADNSGTRTWIGWYGPYGENPAGSMPDNSAAARADWAWHGEDQRLTDGDLIHMGARPYVPSLGRFLAVDPIEGGCANTYVYVYGNPVKDSDLTGKWWILDDIADAVCDEGPANTVVGGLSTWGGPLLGFAGGLIGGALGAVGGPAGAVGGAAVGATKGAAIGAVVGTVVQGMALGTRAACGLFYDD